MAREQVAGALVLNKLRERIIAGLYLGYWRPGDRLPSIREIADSEGVDRKTAAAAYRRLQEEGLVRVRSRSGIYLTIPSLPDPPGPMERLYRRWLKHTYDGARALGLDTSAIQRFMQAVAEIERLRLPVLESSPELAQAIANELKDRLAVRAVPLVLGEARPGEPALAEACVIVTTPYHGSSAAALAPGVPVIEATLAPELLKELRVRAQRGTLAVLVGSEALAGQVRRALKDYGMATANNDAIRILPAFARGEVAAAARGSSTAFLWPGAPDWIDEVLPAQMDRFRPARILSDDSLSRIQEAILDAAIRRARQLKGPDARGL